MPEFKKILQLHSQYSTQEISGENSSVENIRNALSGNHNVSSIVNSTRSLQGNIYLAIRSAVKYIFSNSQPDFEPYKYDRILIHNTIPFVSPKTLIKHNNFGDLIFFWHNNRRFCLKGTNYRKDQICFKCNGKLDLVNGVLRRCYRGSFLQSLVVALGERKLRRVIKNDRNRHVVFSEYYEKILLSKGIQKKNISLLRHPVNIPITKSPSPDFEKQEKENKKDFLAVGRIESEKGFFELIEAWESVNQDLKGDSTLHIVGDGPQLAKLRNLNLGSICFHGKLSIFEIAQLAKKCRAGIVPSKCPESFGKVVIEFFAMNLPVIVNPSGALPELASLVDKNLITDGNSAIDLAKTLTKFLFENNDYGNKPQEVATHLFDSRVWQENLEQIVFS